MFVTVQVLILLIFQQDIARIGELGENLIPENIDV